VIFLVIIMTPIKRCYDLGTSVDTFNRPSDTTAYSIGDVISPTVTRSLNFPVSVYPLGIYLSRVYLVTNKSSHIEALRLHLSLTASTLLAVDNLPLTMNVSPVGVIDFTDWKQSGNFASCEGSFGRFLQISPNYAQAALFGLLESRSAFTPNADQTFSVSIYTEASI
jgi:hypothetical protein